MNPDSELIVLHMVSFNPLGNALRLILLSSLDTKRKQSSERFGDLPEVTARK